MTLTHWFHVTSDNKTRPESRTCPYCRSEMDGGCDADYNRPQTHVCHIHKCEQCNTLFQAHVAYADGSVDVVQKQTGNEVEYHYPDGTIS